VVACPQRKTAIASQSPIPMPHRLNVEPVEIDVVHREDVGGGVGHRDRQLPNPRAKWEHLVAKRSVLRDEI